MIRRNILKHQTLAISKYCLVFILLFGIQVNSSAQIEFTPNAINMPLFGSMNWQKSNNEEVPILSNNFSNWFFIDSPNDIILNRKFTLSSIGGLTFFLTTDMMRIKANGDVAIHGQLKGRAVASYMNFVSADSRHGDPDYIFNLRYVTTGNGTNTNADMVLYAPIHVPAGAKITKATIHYKDENIHHAMTVSLIGQDLNDPAQPEKQEVLLTTQLRPNDGGIAEHDFTYLVGTNELTFIKAVAQESDDIGIGKVILEYE